MLIREIEAKDVGLFKAMELSRLVLDVFAQENYSEVLLGPLYIKELRSESRTTFRYKKLVLFFALDLWKRAKLCNNRNWEVIGDSGDLIGFSSWNVPIGSKTPPSIWTTAYRWIIERAVSLGEFLLCLGDGKDSLLAQGKALGSVTAQMDDEIGWLKVPEATLAHFDNDKLSKTIYHRKQMWWCSKMVIDPKYQRQGYGFKLFKHCLDNIEPYRPIFEDGDVKITAPAKYGLCSSENGRRLYEKFGFRLYKTASRYVGDVKLERPIYIKNYSEPLYQF
ncbi:hypothetical protein B9G98_00806 [Wickerhamiella sorbophila]|uniref:N-acetyltransferase domain-containing protein n=1 Tax=Wickerhamiella sorbophila TaxID=45607 RepID=A0A2T0FDV0_9ASCO|nr:hypothetical protein B9G98_00806 [Wickerhamiella sorbophila]PRT53186.1 hypothetical protein B9G98_00806 [Wickerhamiella sorbophila]